MKSLVASKYDNNNSAQERANNDKLCTGCKQYTSTRGQAMQTCEQSTPTWTQCKTSKDKWYMSLFCAGIIDTAAGKQSGRTMSVQGYALLGPIVYPNEKSKSLGYTMAGILALGALTLLPKLHGHIWSLLWIAKKQL